ncbi:hypothetical protein MM221_12800 [Salipaludibacillus sp. LMS25]|uniref:hypothetical protein n=1 Tax=Salipaludibacillus sp. LMS25 TaxID=2924031 RepID=UPI0020D0FAB1|nr:hypothetical protein [Salipaludibacillus sp. LMS25]UTR13506.1 hypothetical protein MM221_12800 [Salipaludibacillus sp. LMS25]
MDNFIHYRELLGQVMCIKDQYHIIVNQSDNLIKQWQKKMKKDASVKVRSLYENALSSIQI